MLNQSVKTSAIELRELEKKAQKISRFRTNTAKSTGRLVNEAEIRKRLDLLKNYWTQYEEAWNKYDVDSDDDQVHTEDDYANVEAEYITASCELEELLPQPMVNTERAGASTQANSANDVSVVRIKAIEPPKFSGQLEDWVSFRDLFESTIIKNPTLSEIHILQYLRGSCTGKAAEIIKDISISAGNFTVAWDALKRRYENERLLVSRLIERLFELPAMSRECPLELAKLLDGASQVLSALAVLKRPTQHWDDILVVHISLKLDFNTRLAWEKSIGATTTMPQYKQLDEFLSSLLRSLEAMRTIPSKGKGITATASSSNVNSPKRFIRSHVLNKETQPICADCRGPHFLLDCNHFIEKSVGERRRLVESSGICFNCLMSSSHPSRGCPSYDHCRVCKRHHHTLLHVNEEQPNNTTTMRWHNPFGQRQVNSNVCKYETDEDKGAILPTAWLTITASNGRSLKLRALIDQGSEATLVSRSAIHQLGISWTKSDVGVTGVAGSSAGKVFGCVKLNISSTSGNGKSLSIKALVLANISNLLPSRLFHRSNHPKINSLALADDRYWQPKRVDVLLGASLIPELLLNGMHKADGLVAQQTIFGWIISGSATTATNSPTTQLCSHISLDKLLVQFWEQEEQHQRPTMSADDQACEEFYNRTTKRIDDGRYMVELPFKRGRSDLGDSRATAIRRFIAVEKRGINNTLQWQQYKEFMSTYLELGHMEHIPEDEMDNSPQCYLPHHAVFKADSTSTKLRVVFDASATTSNGRSLNEILMVGPRLQDNLSTILLRWRMYRIAICADIEKMYRQIRINPSQCDYQRIVWRPHSNMDIQHYRLLTVTYGTSSAPYLAIKTLQRLADDEKTNFPLASKILKRDFYVDDCMTGSDTLHDAKQLKEELIGITNAAGLRLLKWSSNSKPLLQTLPKEHVECDAPLNIEDDSSVKALGVRWHPRTDEFTYNVKSNNQENGSLTKRQVLSEIAKLFDPLGLLAPIIISAKILMQQLWITGLGWDDKLPDDINKKWQNFKGELIHIEQLRINRWCGHSGSKTIQLHGFSDASQLAYAACVYARIQHENGSVAVTLLAAKTKVSPIKQQCIPRLELNGAVLLSRLLDECQQALCDKPLEIFAWTDSMVVLAWLRRHANVWQTFVANRVSEIQAKSGNIKWQHVSGIDNPADVASRGIAPSKIRDHLLWWTGPSWLRESQQSWPVQQLMEVNSEVLEERKQLTCNIATTKTMFYLADKYSSWIRLLRVTALCRRVMKKYRKEEQTITADDIHAARIIWLRILQQFEFGDVEKVLHDASSKLHKLRPFVDSNGLLRVGGRLANADTTFNEQHPIIITGKSPIAILIIRDAHERVFHGGPQNTLGKLHQQYWLVGGRRLVRSLIHKCVICTKARPKLQQQIMGNLPAARVRPSRPFTHTGVDYAGPIWSRTTKGRGHGATKSYIAVFICFSSKAVHLELVSDMTTDAFIAAFRRFTARRGHCSNIYCDNGTNFVGAAKTLREIVKRTMKDERWQSTLTSEGTKFHFAPPGSPHFNGLAEATVRMAKTSLIKVIGEQKLTFEELSTCLYQIEAAINSRPLCVLPSDGTDCNVLTPGHFLIGQPLTAFPEPNIAERSTPTHRWQLVQQMVQRFWNRWSHEYLHQLQQRSKWTKPARNIQVGDIVMIQDDSFITRWKLGRVIETHPGNDGQVRVASMKTSTGIVKRAIVKLCVLPIEQDGTTTNCIT